MTLTTRQALNTDALSANYLEATAPAATRSTEIYQRPIVTQSPNWERHLPHPLWGAATITRRRFEILAIALGSLGYTLQYDVSSADTTLQQWKVTKGAIAGTMYHNAADDAFYMLGLPVIPAFSRCVFWL